MPERVKLQEPGSEFVMVVSKVTPETVEGIDYSLFTNGNKELLVPYSSVKSQLDRLGVENIGGIVGLTVKFSRSTKLSKYGKAFWNLDLASGAEAPSQSAGGDMGKPNAGTPSAAPSAEPAPEKPRLDRIYIRATKLILDEVVPLYTKAGIGCSDGAVAAMVATLFIAASKVESQ